MGKRLGANSEPSFPVCTNRWLDFKDASTEDALRVPSGVSLMEGEGPALGWGTGREGGALHLSCGCQVSVIAFPAFSVHSRANDVFWESVCLPSEAKCTFLDSQHSVHGRAARSPAS